MRQTGIVNSKSKCRLEYYLELLTNISGLQVTYFRFYRRKYFSSTNFNCYTEKYLVNVPYYSRWHIHRELYIYWTYLFEKYNG